MIGNSGKVKTGAATVVMPNGFHGSAIEGRVIESGPVWAEVGFERESG